MLSTCSATDAYPQSRGAGTHDPFVASMSRKSIDTKDKRGQQAKQTGRDEAADGTPLGGGGSAAVECFRERAIYSSSALTVYPWGTRGFRPAGFILCGGHATGNIL